MKYFIVWEGPLGSGAPRIETLGSHSDQPHLFDTKEQAEVHIVRSPIGRTHKSKVYAWPFATKEAAGE